MQQCQIISSSETGRSSFLFPSLTIQFSSLIRCSDGSVSCHKLLLASISDLLHAELSKHDEDVVSLLLPDYTTQNVEHFLKNIFKPINVHLYSDLLLDLGCTIRVSDIKVEKPEVKDDSFSDPDLGDEPETSSQSPPRTNDNDDLEMKAEGNEDDIDNVVIPFRQRADKIEKVNAISVEAEGSRKSKQSLVKKKGANTEKRSVAWKYFDQLPDDKRVAKCKLCCEFIRNPPKANTAIITHLRRKHNIGEIEPSLKAMNVCSFCGKNWEQNHLRTLCERRHTKTYTHFCEFEGCGKKFFTMNALAQHRRTHTQERRFQCNICGKKFNQSSHLKAHTRSHTGETPYECDKCHQKFKYTANHRSHKCIT